MQSRHLEAVTTSSLMQSHLFCPLHMNNYVQSCLWINQHGRKNSGREILGDSLPNSFQCDSTNSDLLRCVHFTADETSKNNNPIHHGGKSLTPSIFQDFF